MALTQKPHEGERWVGRGGGGGWGWEFPSSERSGMLVRINIGMKLPNKTNPAWLILGENLKISYVL